MPNLSHPACVCRLARYAFADKKVKDAHANEKSGTASKIEKSIVKKMADGSAPAQPNPSPSLMPNLTHPACVCRLARYAFAGKKVKDAHANVKSGTATKIEKSIVEKMAKGHATLASKGTHGGYIVLDDKGVERNARLHFHRNQPRFHIYISRKTFYIVTGCSELEIGSSHTCQGHTLTVQREL